MNKYIGNGAYCYAKSASILLASTRKNISIKKTLGIFKLSEF